MQSAGGRGCGAFKIYSIPWKKEQRGAWKGNKILFIFIFALSRVWFSELWELTINKFLAFSLILGFLFSLATRTVWKYGCKLLWIFPLVDHRDRMFNLAPTTSVTSLSTSTKRNPAHINENKNVNFHQFSSFRCQNYLQLARDARNLQLE